MATKEELEAKSKSMSEAIQNVADAALNASTASDAFDKVLTALTDEFSKHEKEIAKVVAAYGELEVARRLQGSDVYQFYIKTAETAAMIPRQLAAEIAGGNVLAADQLSKSAKAIQESAYADQVEMTKRFVDLGKDIAGRDITLPVASYFKDAAALGEAFYNGAMADTRLYNAAVEALNSESAYRMKEVSAFAMKGLALDTQDMRQIYQEEFSKTGKITDKFITDFASTVLAAGQISGMGPRQISEDLQVMIRDVDKFGNMTYSQMASLSTTVRQLGIDINDVAAVAGRFMSFENAASAISNIGAVTGATLDTMELFYLANEDKEEFFRSMRQQLLDQGVTLENLSHQEQVYLSKQLGFSNVRQLQSLLNEDIELTSENITSLIEETAEKKRGAEADLIDELAQAGGFAKATMDAMKPEAMQETLNQLKSLAAGTNDFASATVRLNNHISTTAQQAVPTLVASGKALETAFITSMKGAEDAITALNNFIDKFIASGGLKKIEDAIKKSKIYPQSMPPLWQDVLDGTGMFLKEMSGNFDGLTEDLKKKMFAMSTAVGAGLQASTAKVQLAFDDLKKQQADKLKEIEASEKEIAAAQAARLKEATSLESSFKNWEGTDPRLREKMLQEKYGGEGKALTDDDVSKIIMGLENADASVITSTLTARMKAQTEEAVAKLTGASPASGEKPEAPGAAPAGAKAPETPAKPVAGPAGPTAAGNMEINVKMNFDKDELSRLIINEILPEAVTGGIKLTGPQYNGLYTFKLDPVGGRR